MAYHRRPLLRFHHEEHTHGDLTHPHTHGAEPHVPENGAPTEHGCDKDCAACAAGCDPMQETLALMSYMVNHNAAHARELAELAKKLGELGNRAAAEQVLAAVSEFEKGNLRLSAVLASLK